MASAALLWGGPSTAWCACKGRDGFARLAKEDPAAFASLQAQARAMPFGKAHLYRIEKGDLRPSFLYGTLHLADARVTALTPEVVEALSASQVLALEIKDPGNLLSGTETKEKLARSLAADEDQRADRLLDADEFRQLAATARPYGLSDAAVRRLKPTVLALLMDTPRCAVQTRSDTAFLDLLLARTAAKKQIRVVGLETVTEQIDAMDGLSDAAERQLLRRVIMRSDYKEEDIETSIQAYSAGNLGELLAWMRVSYGRTEKGDPVKIPSEFLDRLLDARNERMLDRVIPFLAQGGAFVAVGAAHIPGADGLANLIHSRGYELQVVY